MNKKTRKAPGKHPWNWYVKRTICTIVLAVIAAVPWTIFSGCSPAAFAASAFVLSYLDEQVQNDRRASQQASNSRPKVIRLDKQQYSQPVPDKRRISRSSVQQPTGPQIITKAVRAYESLDWNEAKRLFCQALEKEDISRTLKWQSWVFLGAIAYQKGNISEAQKCFIKAARQDSGKLPSSELFPPPMIKFYKSVRKRNV